ncbi:transcriptional regulator TetR/AcrR family [Cupriavidus necator N-1]|jgi:TetR/AcrR family transcriptional regulator|uniref:Transcriptional regulator TetR/AcrR family n=1 Tax=Cupriavidus necator (strain ATCC 43291 / DSM 13513 / CCUG 52238 / LMG 8453 / N-1) TaxID=1042878 RepID=F8GPR4_CUPNN|nr:MULTISPECIES: TetR/AcrR family transcriptional regulator [Cupriavidus]AEI80551.1 transcriptional regulator TetR/AcrR family [Cupriavidus necator N-1]KAI3595535.1 Transcriptional regulator of pyrimidine catabolism (TetR family) [Cupriavidus necator H850]MDX6009822.1 TetR/AcrR family transcriptional regulator [Cupriavidus necator]QUN30764.1 TetR family transcriptional regulator C-terminal domain-containing protein [Cupriavidus sp. KK10]
MDAPASATARRPLPACDAPGGRIRQENQAMILHAAEHVFARAGFAGATMAEIAMRAGVPKSNLHYYFRTKQALYRAVLAHTLQLWLSETDIIRAELPPQVALEQYIRAKMRLSASHPDASRVFANELLHGAHEIGEVLRQVLRELVSRKAAVVQQWIDRGQMAPVDPQHLFFTIWAATQTYADFESQVCAVLGVSQLKQQDYAQATEHLVALLLRGCGLEPEPAAPDRRV